jgi:ferritin-like metal-binding protein YciE
MAKMKKLEDLFHDALKDVYFAEKKITRSAGQGEQSDGTRSILTVGAPKTF